MYNRKKALGPPTCLVGLRTQMKRNNLKFPGMGIVSNKHVIGRDQHIVDAQVTEGWLLGCVRWWDTGRLVI